MRRLLVLLLSVLCFAVPAWIEAQPQRPALPAVAGPTTSAQLRGIVTDPLGTGSLLFDGAPGVRFTSSTDSNGIFPLLPGQTPPTITPALSVGANQQDGMGANTLSTIFNGNTSIVYNRSITPIGNNRSVNVNPLRTDIGSDFAHGDSGSDPRNNADSTSFRWQGMSGNRTSTLAADVSSVGQTTITVNCNANTDYWPLAADDPSNPDPDTRNLWSQDLALYIGTKTSQELVIPTNFDRATCVATGVARGQRGTTAATWPAGTTVTLYRMTTFASAQYWNHSNTVGSNEGSIRFFTMGADWDPSSESDQRTRVAELNAKSYFGLDGSLVGLGLDVPNGSAVSVHTGSNTNLPLRFGDSTTQVDTIDFSIAPNHDGTGTMTVTSSASSAVAVGTSVQWGAGNKALVISLGTGTGGTGTYVVSSDSNVSAKVGQPVYGTTFTGPGLYANNKDLRVATDNGTDLWQFRQNGQHSTTGRLQIYSGTAPSAGGAAATGFMIGSTTNFGIAFGCGAPTATFANGSLYLRSDGPPSYTIGSGNWVPIGPRAVVTNTAANYTMLKTDTDLVMDRAGTVTITLLSAASYCNRDLWVTNVQAQAVTSNAANVIPLGSNTAGTAILTNTAGKWARLVSDCTNWRIMAAN